MDSETPSRIFDCLHCGAKLKNAEALDHHVIGNHNRSLFDAYEKSLESPETSHIDIVANLGAPYACAIEECDYHSQSFYDIELHCDGHPQPLLFQKRLHWYTEYDPATEEYEQRRFFMSDEDLYLKDFPSLRDCTCFKAGSSSSFAATPASSEADTDSSDLPAASDNLDIADKKATADPEAPEQLENPAVRNTSTGIDTTLTRLAIGLSSFNDFSSMDQIKSTLRSLAQTNILDEAEKNLKSHRDVNINAINASTLQMNQIWEFTERAVELLDRTDTRIDSSDQAKSIDAAWTEGRKDALRALVQKALFNEALEALGNSGVADFNECEDKMDELTIYLGRALELVDRLQYRLNADEM
ncbi:hypothetical protein BJ508DRAFT_328231 [Ascobolus immersus RN42]|uniref:C2H2-type domain-containing protein n=1 Tax=Ascobolus immersus RN42 TaxID=1160509 RepID=A0A3N4I0L4_ASCIM|nr:hypothetical protein BJ508DRAFT_328231 [Ascobolus immersus RN42]